MESYTVKIVKDIDVDWYTTAGWTISNTFDNHTIEVRIKTKDLVLQGRAIYQKLLLDLDCLIAELDDLIHVKLPTRVDRDMWE